MPAKRQFVCPEVIRAIERDLVPLLVEANADSSEALSLRPDRYTEGSMGYITWDHARRAVWEVLGRSPDWRVSNQENDLVLTCLAGPEDFRLRVCRVHPRTRLPTSGKRARENACQGPWLSDQLQHLMYPTREFLVGYDTGILSGVGKITLQVLWSSADSLYSRTLALLYDASVQDSMQVPAIRENIPKGKPSRRQERPNPVTAHGKK